MKLYEQMKKQWILNNPDYTDEELEEYIKHITKMLNI